MFINTSNQLGEFESGLLAAWVGAVPAVLIGGVGTLVVVGLWMVLFPTLRRRQRLQTQPSRQAPNPRSPSRSTMWMPPYSIASSPSVSSRRRAWLTRCRDTPARLPISS